MRLVHRPRGIGHPYARSADQRSPLVPVRGTTVDLGVVVHDGVPSSLTCEWDDGEVHILDLAPASNLTDAAALAGGSGHLSAAQESVLTTPGAWTVTSPAVTGPVRYRFVGAMDGNVTATEWFTIAPGDWVEDAGRLTTTSAATERLVPGSVAWLVSDDGVHRVRFALRLDASEHVMGFGERFDALDQRGTSLDAVVFEQYKKQGEHRRTYLPMPFAHVIGGAGWGFHVETTRRTWYDVGHSVPNELRIEAEVGALRSLERDPADATLNVAGYSGTPGEVLDAFLSDVGRPRLLPEWVFRLWASGNEWNTQDRVMEVVDTHRDLDIPVGAVVIEAWSDEQGITVPRDAEYPIHRDGAPFKGHELTYPADGAWPDPAGMISELKSRGIRTLLWQIPLTKTEDSERELGEQVKAEAQALVESGFAIREEDGSPYRNRGWWFPQALMPDLSTAQGRAWWTERRRYLVRDLGVDGFKTDGGEHAWGAELRYAPVSDEGPDRRGDAMNNLNPVNYSRAFCELLESEGQAPVTFSRAGFTGSQQWGLHWAGDEDSTWQAFRNSVTAGLTASASGILYWGWDMAGFSGPVPGPELYLRAAWASVFMPVMQYHSEFNHHREPKRDRTPWWVAEVNDAPWVIDEFREAVRAREELVPYLAESARRSIATGLPLMRTLAFGWPEDARVWDFPTQWMLGDDLLVCPVLEEGAQAIHVYLPHLADGASWVDHWSGARVEAGEHHVDVSIGPDRGHRSPVFRRVEG